LTFFEYFNPFGDFLRETKDAFKTLFWFKK